MKDDFKNAKIVYVATFGEHGKQYNRPMTNYNEDPYVKMWFPTFRATKKIEHIAKNPKIKIIFPSSKEGDLYEVTGTASLAPEEEVRNKWSWWMFFWHPEFKKYSLFQQGSWLGERRIIDVHPLEASIINGKEFDFTVTA
jgi:general stress protein 26